MRNISPPSFGASAVFDDCVSTIGSAAKRADFNLAKNLFLTAESGYQTAAEQRELYKLPATTAANSAILYGSLSKADIKGLYTDQLVPKAKIARKHYDKILVSIPHRRCPLCGFGRATTLDHHLNKGEYPWLAIVPINLVPACKECNHWKSDDRAMSAEEQSIHPYFEDGDISNDQWLFAKVIQTKPVSLEYELRFPATWAAPLRLRVERHLANFDLKARFSIEAGSELASLRNTIRSLRDKAGDSAVRHHLEAIALGEFELHKNSWRTAMFQALAASAWYRQTGYLLG